MAITGKVTLDLSQRTVGRLGLLWNRLTPTRGANVVSGQIAMASRRGPVTVSVSREQLSIRMGEQETPIYRSEAYARCLWKAGVTEVEIGNGINSAEVKGTLNALADKDFITPSSRIGFDLKGLDGRTIETMKKGTSLGTISRTGYSSLSQFALIGSIALAAGSFMLEGCSRKPEVPIKTLKTLALLEKLRFDDKNENGIIERESWTNLWRNEGYGKAALADINSDGQLVEAEILYYLHAVLITADPDLKKFHPITEENKLALAPLFAEKAEQARAISNSNRRARSFSDEAASEKDPDRARYLQSTASDIDSDNRSYALQNIVAEMTKAGLFKEAQEIAETIENCVDQELAYAAIATEMAKAGLFKEALEIAGAIDEPEYSSDKSSFLFIISSEMAKTGLFKEAIDIAKTMEDSDYYKPRALHNIASEMAKAGLFKEALEIAGAIGDYDVKLDAYCNISTEMAKAGLFKEALETARAITPSDKKLEALSNLASEMLRAGIDHEEATKLFKEEINDPFSLIIQALLPIANDDTIAELITGGLYKFINDNENDWFEQIQNILFEKYKTGNDESMVKAALKKMLLAESYSYGHREAILSTIGSEDVKQLIRMDYSRFFGNMEDASCHGSHDTAHYSCSATMKSFRNFLRNVLMLRTSPKGELPNFDVVRDIYFNIGKGGFVFISHYPSSEYPLDLRDPNYHMTIMRAAYLIAYVEKNMNFFSYKGHKVWEFADKELFKKTFGEGKIVYLGLEYENPDERQQKRIAIMHLVIENPDLFEKTFPLDPRIEEIK